MLMKQRCRLLWSRINRFWCEPLERGWILVGYLVLTLGVAWAVATVDANQQQTRQTIEEIQELRANRLKDQATTNQRICERQQATNQVLIELIQGIIRLPPAPGQTEQQRRERLVPLQEALAALKPENCARFANGPIKDRSESG